MITPTADQLKHQALDMRRLAFLRQSIGTVPFPWYPSDMHVPQFTGPIDRLPFTPHAKASRTCAERANWGT